MKGLREMERKLEHLLLRQVPEKAGRDVRDLAFAVAGEAMRRAPVDTGHLRDSGYVTMQDNLIARGSGGSLQIIGQGTLTGEVLTAKIGFNATTPDGRYSYALIQHERTDFHHPRGGEAKYLENSMREIAGRYQDTLARERFS